MTLQLDFSMGANVAVCFLLLLAVSHSAKSSAKISKCEVGSRGELSWNRMEVLPGVGWDNLHNTDMSLVFEYDYTNCQLTNDRKFLLPKGYFAIPFQQSGFETIFELFNHWDNYSSLTSASINTEESEYSGINGKFSYDYIKMKGNMYNDKSIVARSQVRRKLYIIRIVPGAPLHPTFKSRLLNIAAYIAQNETVTAEYLSELLVRDYGTHFISAVHVGAIIVQEDYIKNTFTENFEESKPIITASVSANFMEKIGFNKEKSHISDTNSTQYLSQLIYSHIRTYGGPPYDENFNINNWDNDLEDNLAAINREGELLHFAITSESLNELSPTQTQELASYVENAVTKYYKLNTQYGCTNPNTESFYFGANIDDGSCQAPVDNFMFGGVYQTCRNQQNSNSASLCQQLHLTQINPITGNCTCPSNYEPVLLYSGSTATVFYKLFWCMATAKASNKSGYLFGGLYNSVLMNPLTNSKSCPNQYYPLGFGLDTKVCVSRNYEQGISLSVPFGGFESCHAGNPLAISSSSKGLEFEQNNWPHRCPSGYSAHLANIEQSCEIKYCIKIGSLNEPSLAPVMRPPFQAAPTYPHHPISHSFDGSNSTRRTIVAIILISTTVLSYLLIVVMCGKSVKWKLINVAILHITSFCTVSIVEYAILIYAV